jgi:hypothetical protein
MTAILRIEHQVADFDHWRRAFDSDPEERQASGVRRYRIMRAGEDGRMALIDLEFEAPEPAREFLQRLRALWDRVDFVSDPQVRVAELVDERTLAAPPT